MKNYFTLFLLMIGITLNACSAPVAATPASPPAISTVAPVPTLVPIAPSPTIVQESLDWKSYSNSAFGLQFQYPFDWFGPDEYVSDQLLRVQVGSDIVYPYGTDLMAQIYERKNSYYVLIQYSKNDQNQNWKDTYQALINLEDGESVSDARRRIIKVRDLRLGGFEGIEYISTLSETAQTEPVYTRQVILFDDQSNVLTIMGTPNNVEVGAGTGWREIYQKIDKANQILFSKIVESISVE